MYVILQRFSMWLMVTFRSQFTTSLLYKLAVHRAIFLPYIMSSEYEATVSNVTATCHHAHLGTRSIEHSSPQTCANVRY